MRKIDRSLTFGYRSWSFVWCAILLINQLGGIWRIGDQHSPWWSIWDSIWLLDLLQLLGESAIDTIIDCQLEEINFDYVCESANEANACDQKFISSHLGFIMKHIIEHSGGNDYKNIGLDCQLDFLNNCIKMKKLLQNKNAYKLAELAIQIECGREPASNQNCNWLIRQLLNRGCDEKN